ncbi:MAG TPA: hypothetical protein GX497_10570 [Bacillus bacterium]|nr:hypothetical protein [Bacillus sp. (in: firmicutes)]
MNSEMWILVISILCAAVLLWIFIPRRKIVDAQISFLFMQVQTWLFGAIVVENRLIEYPVRLMDYAYRVSFSFEYFIFPAVSAVFNVNFPRGKSFGYKTVYSVFYPSVMTAAELLLEKYTDTIKYIHWTWYWSWITIFITLLISHWYYLWFINKVKRE